MTAVERGTDLRGAILERVRAMSVGRDFSALVWTRQRRTTVGMGSLRHRRIKERTILEEGEINDFRDRMGACRSPMRSYPVLPTKRLLRTWTRFLSPISFYPIVLRDNAPSDVETLLFSGIGLWISLSLSYTSCSRRLHQERV